MRYLVPFLVPGTWSRDGPTLRYLPWIEPPVGPLSVSQGLKPLTKLRHAIPPQKSLAFDPRILKNEFKLFVERLYSILATILLGIVTIVVCAIVKIVYR